jgi:hypothetical protein
VERSKILGEPTILDLVHGPLVGQSSLVDPDVIVGRADGLTVEQPDVPKLAHQARIVRAAKQLLLFDSPRPADHPLAGAGEDLAQPDGTTLLDYGVGCVEQRGQIGDVGKLGRG